MANEHGPRWWPLLGLAALAAVALGVIWGMEAPQRQVQVMRTMMALVLTGACSVAWLLFFSRLPWKRRLVIFGALVLMSGGLSASVRIRGVDGDLVPILAWRWQEWQEEGRHLEKTGVLAAADYPQFLGPRRNGRLEGVRLARDWAGAPPQLVWRRAVGPAWSSFAVVGERALTQEQHGDEERVVCYALATGEELWRYGYAARYSTTLGGTGPRATPTVVGDRVYTLGATGILTCVELADGRLVWQRDILADNNAPLVPWGMSSSPLVLGDRVVVSAGGPDGRALVAYGTADGGFVWGGGGATAGYSSPNLATIAGGEQILIFNRARVAAHDPGTGQVLWDHAWPGDTECVAQPVVLPGDRVLVSSGYGAGAKLFQIGRAADGTWSAAPVWESKFMKAKFANMVYHNGYIYGLDDGILACIDVAQGQRQWKRGRYGHGQLILVDDMLVIQAESGDVVLVEAKPQAHNELGRFTAFRRKTWNSPALAGPYLLVRNDQEAACFELALE